MSVLVDLNDSMKANCQYNEKSEDVTYGRGLGSGSHDQLVASWNFR